MSDKPKITPIKPEVNEATVRQCEEWLERAKAGEIIGVVAYGHLRGGTFITAYNGIVPYLEVLGALDRLKYRVNQLIDSRSEEEESD